jgi:hypothetical protein
MLARSLFYLALGALFAAPCFAQQHVTLPLPHLLTVTPMGGQAGTSVDVAITGENLENVSELLFSSPKITAKPVAGAENKFTVSIAPDAPVGVYDARVLSRLGVSSARAFSVGKLAEISRTKPNNSLETALALPANTVCNATMTQRAVDFYSFSGTKGKRVVVECGAGGIDSRLRPVLIVADAQGRDLVVNRTSGLLDFTPSADGTYIIKVNDLTFQGGEHYFYRLAFQDVPTGAPVPRQARTKTVSAMSWPPVGLSANAPTTEVEPNDKPSQAQKINLPCDIAGSFYPAADVDTYEFTAKKGETWWVEVASERLGLNTVPFVLVQQVKKTGDTETLSDVAELSGIPSPMKVSSNGYSYDGPVYDAGSPDVNGKFEIKEDGNYRLQIHDLLGGTRNDPGNIYRLIVRQATPDFSLAAWAVHMTLRNGDRSAISKPMALRAGGARVFEVVAVRRDGFDGDIDIAMDNLPPGVTAMGLKIAKGKSYGHLVLTAAEDAKPGFSLARITGHATINGATVTRDCPIASTEWPVKDASQEVPAPRLLADEPVSVTDSEKAPLTIAAADDKVFEAKAGETLKIPLKLTWRNEFTGSSIKLSAYGEGFTTLKPMDVPNKAGTAELVLDLATLKTPPGEYTLALYGSGVSKYRYNPGAVPLAEAELKKAEQALAEAKQLAADKQKEAEATMAGATKHMKAVTAAAAPTETVDIIVSQPIRISVKAAQPAAATAAK